MVAQNSKLTPLEGQRGIAAIIVAVHHFLLAFHPSVSGIILDKRDENSLVGSPLFFFVNGHGAVYFFFTLSGFVLSWSFFIAPDPRKLILAMLKRWPRLAGPVVIVCIVSAVVFSLDLYFFSDAGLKSGSFWLETFGHSAFSEQKPSITAALWQGSTTFFTGQAGINPSLWTMVYEYYGSLLVFATIPIIWLLRKWPAYLFLSFIFSAVFSFAYLKGAVEYITLMMPFIAGVGCSYALTRSKMPEISLISAFLLMAFGIYLLGYFEPLGAYAWLGVFSGSGRDVGWATLYSVGSVCVICSTMTNRRIFSIMNNSLMLTLGRISFPLYLVHLIVIGSATSWLYLNVFSEGGLSLFLSTAAICVVCSYPLTTFDEWWVKKLNSKVQMLKRRLDKRHSLPNIS